MKENSLFCNEFIYQDFMVSGSSFLLGCHFIRHT